MFLLRIGNRRSSYQLPIMLFLTSHIFLIFPNELKMLKEQIPFYWREKSTLQENSFDVIIYLSQKMFCPVLSSSFIKRTNNLYIHIQLLNEAFQGSDLSKLWYKWTLSILSLRNELSFIYHPYPNFVIKTSTRTKRSIRIKFCFE